MNCLEKKDRGSAFFLWLMIAATFVSMLFCCAYTSPLYPHYSNSDSPIFILIGKGITEGKLCYVDLFDHKGPVLFFIEALGWTIGGRTGIWLLECLAMLLSELAILGICRQLKAKPWLPIISSAIVLFYTFCHGNLTEDYSLPLIYGSMFFAVKFFLSDSDKHQARYAYFYGISVGLIAFIRINNALIIFALILGIMIDLIRKQQIPNMIANLAAGLLGIATIAVPICLYFYVNGALYDMLYATFLYNLVYAEESSHLHLWENFLFVVLYAPIVFSVIVFFKSRDRYSKPMITSLLIASVLSLIMLLYANVYEHYFTLAIPLFTLAVAMAAPQPSLRTMVRPKEGKTALLVCLGLIVLAHTGLATYRAAAPFYKSYLTDIAYDRYYQMSESAKEIPEEERDSVLGLGIPVEWYLDMDITPCYKYYTLQQWWSTSENDVYGDTVAYIESNHPDWLITKVGSDYGVDEIKKTYELVEENDYASFYRYVG